MAIEYSIVEQVTGGSKTGRKRQSVDASAHTQVVEKIADGTSDEEVAIEIDVSAVKALYINSTQDMTLETNDTGSPDDTLNLLANVPCVWHENSYYALLLTVDVTALYLTNSSGSDATLNVWALYDSTP